MKPQDPKPAASRVTNTSEQEVVVNQSAQDGDGYDVPESSVPPPKKSGSSEQNQTVAPDLPERTVLP